MIFTCSLACPLALKGAALACPTCGFKRQKKWSFNGPLQLLPRVRPPLPLFAFLNSPFVGPESIKPLDCTSLCICFFSPKDVRQQSESTDPPKNKLFIVSGQNLSNYFENTTLSLIFEKHA